MVTPLIFHKDSDSRIAGRPPAVNAMKHRQEVFEMRRTIADELKEEGAIKNSQQTLIRLLKRRFGSVPDEVTSMIRGTDDPEQLNAWLDQVVTAETLDEVGIEMPA